MEETHSAAGRFGNSWFSAFDAGIVFDDTPNTHVAIVYTENDGHAAFEQHVDGTWLQVWPTSHKERGTLTGSEASGYSYREPRSSIVRTYGGAGNHHLTEFLDLRTGHSVLIDYDANGMPLRVRDDAGRWSCTVTTTVSNGNTYVTQISVDGRPDLVWNYSYGGAWGAFLVSVGVAGAPAPWRRYEYDQYRSMPDAFYLSRVRDGLGNIIEQHSYDGAGHALSSLGPSGDFPTIQYNFTGTPTTTTTVTRADGSVTTFQQSFVTDHDATVRIDGGCTSCGGHDLTHALDSFGHIVRTQDGRGYITESTYDASGQHLITSATALTPAGCDPASSPDHCLLSSQDLSTATLSRTAASHTTTYAYEDQNWPEKPTRIQRDSAMTAGQFVTEIFTYDSTTGEMLLDSITGVTGNDRHTETHTTATMLYNGTEAAAFNPGGAFQAAWLSLPQPRGLRKSVDGPRTDASDVTTYVYYPFDTSVPATWRGRPAAVRNAAGLISRFEDYDVFGHAATLTDSNGVMTRLTFDALGRVLTTTLSGVSGCDMAADPLCATDLTTSNEYGSTTGPLTLTRRPNGNVTVYTYDSRGRVTTVSRGSSAADLREQIAYTYDAATQLKATERYLANIGGTWTEKKRESYAYDAFGRLSTATHADGTSIRYSYDAADELASLQDERHASRNTLYAYDPAKRLTTVTQTLATAPGGQAVTTYSYDALDNVTAVTDPNGNTTTYLFDDFGRMVQQTSPVSGTTTYAYDSAGNLIAITDANNATTNRIYDATNRVTSASSSRGGFLETVGWTYDSGSVGVYGLGRLATMSDPSGSTAYAYDRRGSLLSEVKTINSTPYATRYQYDAAGNRSRIVYPSGRVVDSAFDFAERPYSVISGAVTLVSSATYSPFGPLTSMSYGNGTIKTVSLDNRYRVAENKLVGPSGTIADDQYATDPVGNITQIHDSIDPTFNRDFAYDDVNRLITANSGRSLWGNGFYQYDAMGNTLSLTVGAVRTSNFTYFGTTPKLATVTENGVQTSVTYDPAGNEANVAGKVFTYSPRNELLDAGDVSYLYDGRGVRTVTSIPAGAVDITTLALAPSTVFGGDPSTASVTLSAVAPSPGVVVSLSSDNELIATVPATVTVAAGSNSASFNISTSTQYALQNVAIRARVVGSSAAATLTVDFHPYVTSLGFDRSLVDGGTTAVGTVTLNGVVPPSGTVVTLASSNPAAASVPASITIPSGATSGTFTLTSYNVAADLPVTVTATAVTSVLTTVTIRAVPVTVSDLTVAPVNVVGGKMTSTGTVRLNQPALPGGITVVLASSNTNVATVPASVTVPEGSQSTTFSVATSTVGAATPVTISATYATTISAALTVNPCASWSPDAAVLGTGERVWIDDAIPAGGTPYGTWTWDTSKKVSGTQSNTIGPGSGVQQYYFQNASDVMPIDTATEAIVVYALLDPCNPPQEILFQFNTGNNWEHRTYWGANIFSYGTNGTNSRRRLGDLPAVGQWIRLVVPISRVGLGGQTVSGMAFDVVDGRAWFDRVARVSCLTNVPPPSSFPSGEVVWVEDAVPTGAGTSGVWIWDTAQKASGTSSNTDVVIDTDHQHYFINATNRITVGVGDTLFAYALISPCDLPDEIVLQWNDGTWEHRGYWGANLFAYGVDGTNSRRRMGDLPAAGQWVRLEIPASQIGLEGHTLNGLSFDTMGGKVWYDHAGVKRAGSGALLPTPAAVAPAMASSSAQWSGVTRVPLPSRVWSSLRRLIHRPSQPPVALSVAAPSIAVQDITPKQRHSLYTPELTLIAETATGTAASLPVAYEYVWFGDAPLAQIETATNIVHWYFNDHLGAPLLTTNASGAVDWRVEREPYGKMFVRIGGDRHQPLGFPGQESDDESGDRQYNIFRWYRAGWGRYTQVDPMGLRWDDDISQFLSDAPPRFSSSLNLYSYAAAAPGNRIDPTGLRDCDCTRAPDLPSSTSKCDNYGNTVYLGVLLRCFCKCAGDGAWSQQVRGCLACEWEQGADLYVAHERCYAAASRRHAAPVPTLARCYRRCYVGFANSNNGSGGGGW